MPDTDNKLVELKKALDEVLTFLNNPAVTTALGQIPDSIKKPVLDGLKQVLDVIKKALDELKSNLGAVTTVKDLLKVINDLLTAAEGLAPGEKETLDSIKAIVQTLQDLPGAQQIQEILDKIDQIITKLNSL